VARAIEKATRRIDLASRYGGDEFVVALLRSDMPAAIYTAERIRETIAADATSDDPVTVSIGVATFPTDAENKAELLDKADWAMYVAKRAGRDRVVAFSGETIHPRRDD
jgi:diguanylate cyclase (GGDEF)-like protein